MSRFKLLMILVLVLLSLSVLAQLVKTRPGDEPYTPTKVEWAALELQAGFGNSSWTNDQPVTINYMDAGDGATVLCVLQYTPEVSAEVVKLNRDTAQKVFDKYVQRRGDWNWLKLRFDERVIRTH